ncbi:hypothetical protein [Kutzneria kofuensis]|uniref:Uncharacterized protein n=1 Tax=Kutzneria kofuensis TaxID=103725 RepID=A0A7W9NMB5_9PSEU|nr:hypothetical protein [Kutzneria kofuensis]MBB5897965.1 hypothetical protein [Kutzneria kofuensis]
MSGTYRMAAGQGQGLSPVMAATDSWAVQLAPRLFAPPARWGWQAAAPVPVATAVPPAPPARPVWVEPARPDTSGLVAARSKAVTRVIWRLALLVVAAFAFTTYQLVIERQVSRYGSSAHQVYTVILIIVAALLALGVIRAVAGVRFASRNIRNFEQPYHQLRHSEQARYRQALWQWEQTIRQHAAAAAEATRAAAAAANGPQWYPVRPSSEPTRVDVFGGDPHRHGWASLLVTFGSSLLAAGQRITVLDFTGQEVGESLAGVARAGGLSVGSVRLTGDETVGLNLFAGLTARDIAECVGYAATSRPDGDHREERALAVDVLRTVLDALDGPATFAQLAAGVRVLCQGTGELAPHELDKLAAHIGDIDQNEWATRQLRLLARQLDMVHDVVAAGPAGRPLWTNDHVSLVATDGGRHDRKELVDRLLVQLAQRAMDGRGWPGGLLVVAGADHLGATTLQALSDHARHAGVRLILMIDQPQGDLEKSAGTGGVVCIMKMYNHRDATIAAEFIGKGHKFVVNQITRQVGSTFTDGGGDSFAANTNQSGQNKQRRSGTVGRPTGLSESRGHTWTGTRNWSTADNVSTSTGSSRVYEFTVEPAEIMGMPETLFILVDNSGHGRRVITADANPGICLRDRVSAIPAS